MTTLTLTPNFTSKTLHSDGKVCVGEKVDVSVIGVTEAQSANLRVRFRYGGVTVAVYPLEVGDVWVYASSTATANMNLNTDLFRDLYEGFEDRDKLQCVIVVDNPDDENMYSSSQMQVGNWPAEKGLDVPYSLSAYQDDIAALKVSISEIEQGISDTEQFVASHTHNGGTSQQLQHGNLLGIGNNNHAQIDAALTAFSASIQTVSDSANDARVDLNAIKDLCAIVKAMPTTYAAQREARFAALIDGLIATLT